MKFKLLIITFIIIIQVISSCKEGNSPNVESSSKPEVAVQGTSYPGLPIELRNKLMNEATSVDYNWHNLPFSLSMGLEDGLKQNISFISNESPEIIPSTCKPVAHKYYSIKGEIYLDVDLYLNNDCFFYVFLENQKPRFANKITPEGINFYNQVLSQTKKPGQ